MSSFLVLNNYCPCLVKEPPPCPFDGENVYTYMLMHVTLSVLGLSSIFYFFFALLEMLGTLFPRYDALFCLVYF